MDILYETITACSLQLNEIEVTLYWVLLRVKNESFNKYLVVEYVKSFTLIWARSNFK